MMSDADVASILSHCRTIAVVGLSPKPERASFDVARYMQAQGYRIIPVNPNAGTLQILGETVYPNLLEASKIATIDLVNCFRNSADIPPIVDEAMTVNAKALWMQLGVTHSAAAAKAQAAGLTVVQNRCLKIDHQAWRVKHQR